MVNYNYLFLLGRNLELSLAEISAYLEKQDVKVLRCFVKRNGLLIEVDKEIDSSRATNELGGTIAIGKVLFSGGISEIAEGIKNNDIYFGSEEKFIFSIFDFTEQEIELGEFVDAMRDNFKKQRLKSTYKTVQGDIKAKQEIFEGTPSKIKGKINYFLIQDENLKFGVMESIYDAKEAERRDMKKPVRRSKLAMAPRLAKILVNLSEVKKGEILLDPFCGVGGILQEALLQGINVLGIDIDTRAIRSAQRNMAWLKREYKFNSRFDLINDDSRKVNIKEIKEVTEKNINGIATEPQLGKLLTKKPNEREALYMIQKFENLLISVLKNLKEKVKGRIVVTVPVIESNQGKFYCNLGKISRETRLKSLSLNLGNRAIDFPIEEAKKGQVVSRQIYIFE